MRMLFVLCLCWLGHLVVSNELSIAAFNVKTFGQTKLGKEDVMELLNKIVQRYDIMLIQEIRDADGLVIPTFLQLLNDDPSKEPGSTWEVTYSDRLGSTSYKEQYAFFYRSDKVSIQGTYQYDDGPLDPFPRQPYAAWFYSPDTAVQDFALIAIHTSPSSAAEEVALLDVVADEISSAWNLQNIVILGDFNADCSYITNSDWGSIELRTNPKFAWLIGDEVDTTVSTNTDCAYDRIVTYSDQMTAGILPDSGKEFNFENAYGLSNQQAGDVSDHYPVEMKLKAREESSTNTVSGVTTSFTVEITPNDNTNTYSADLATFNQLTAEGFTIQASPDEWSVDLLVNTDDVLGILSTIQTQLPGMITDDAVNVVSSLLGGTNPSGLTATGGTSVTVHCQTLITYCEEGSSVIKGFELLSAYGQTKCSVVVDMTPQHVLLVWSVWNSFIHLYTSADLIFFEQLQRSQSFMNWQLTSLADQQEWLENDGCMFQQWVRQLPFEFSIDNQNFYMQYELSSASEMCPTFLTLHVEKAALPMFVISSLNKEGSIKIWLQYRGQLWPASFTPTLSPDVQMHIYSIALRRDNYFYVKVDGEMGLNGDIQEVFDIKQIPDENKPLINWEGIQSVKLVTVETDVGYGNLLLSYTFDDAYKAAQAWQINERIKKLSKCIEKAGNSVKTDESYNYREEVGVDEEGQPEDEEQDGETYGQYLERLEVSKKDPVYLCNGHDITHLEEKVSFAIPELLSEDLGRDEEGQPEIQGETAAEETYAQYLNKQARLSEHKVMSKQRNPSFRSHAILDLNKKDLGSDEEGQPEIDGDIEGETHSQYLDRVLDLYPYAAETRHDEL